MTTAALDRMAYVFPPEMSRMARASAGPPDRTGRLVTTVPIESIKHGHIELLKLGAEAEVLEPAELRDCFTATARGLAATYLSPPPALGSRSDPFPSTAEESVPMTMPTDLLAHNRKLIGEFRADGGKSLAHRPLLLLTTVGRRSGEKRTSPVMYVPDDDRLLVIASNAGSPADPLWYRNLLAEPSVTVEVPGRTYPARATPLTGLDYDRQWAAVKEKSPFFAEHEARAGDRRIPIVALTEAAD